MEMTKQHQTTSSASEPSEPLLQRTIRLTQTQYIDDIIHHYGCHNKCPLSLPMGTNVKLSTDQSPKTPEDIATMRNIPYRQAIGSLMYASLSELDQTLPSLSQDCLSSFKTLVLLTGRPSEIFFGI
jgi:hypothetical protein